MESMEGTRRKKLHELGVSERLLQNFVIMTGIVLNKNELQNHQMPDTDFIERTEDASGKWEIQQPVNVQDFIKSLDDNKLRKELQKLDQVTLYITFKNVWLWYRGNREIAWNESKNTVSAQMKPARKN